MVIIINGRAAVGLNYRPCGREVDKKTTVIG